MFLHRRQYQHFAAHQITELEASRQRLIRLPVLKLDAARPCARSEQTNESSCIDKPVAFKTAPMTVGLILVGVFCCHRQIPACS